MITKMTDNVLIVEDDKALRNAIRRYLDRLGYRVLEAGSVAEAFEVVDDERTQISVLLVDVALPDGLGFEVLDRVNQRSERVAAIVITGDDTVDNAVLAMQRGAVDYLLKPFSFDALDAAFERANQRRGLDRPLPTITDEENPVERWRQKYVPDVLGNDPQLLKIFGMVERVADTDCSVLISGESGTGKELISRAIHNVSERRDKPFVTVNCAAIPENLLESELFGHARGAFTGATSAKPGRFTIADKGTIFLDEIGELPLALQGKLLRVLQEKEVTPVGEIRTLNVDVRVVAATNRDLELMVAEGKFREDLLYRLNVIPIEMPALRERKMDIPELVSRFVDRANKRRSRSVVGVESAAMDALCRYSWPGNIRQLENTIERLVVLSVDNEIKLVDLPESIRRPEPGNFLSPTSEPALPDGGIDLRDAVERFENALIRQALERSNWNKNQAAGILNMNRTTLVERLKKKDLMEPVARAQPMA